MTYLDIIGGGTVDAKTDHKEQIMDGIAELITPSGEELIVMPKDYYEQITKAGIAPVAYLPEGYAEFITLNGWSPIKAWRKYRRMSQTELAKRCNIDSSCISRAESNGISNIPLAIKMADALRCTISDLIKDDPTQGLDTT